MGPEGETLLSRNELQGDNVEGRGLLWWRRGIAHHLAVLGSDFQVHFSSSRFSRDGRLSLFGTQEGQILVCDLVEIERRLAEFDAK